MNRIKIASLAGVCGLMLSAASCAYLRSETTMKKETGNAWARSGDSPFGVLEFLPWNHPWNHYKYAKEEDLEKAARLMEEAGIRWVRMDFIWQDIEPAEGEFHFGKYDTIVNIFAKHNIHLLGLLSYSTDWASLSGQWNSQPKDNALFVTYAARVVSRYKDKVRHWEIWNEPDSLTYWSQQDGLKSYCELLRDAYRELKRIDPGCNVLNGGFANSLVSVNKLYDNGAKDYFDILNIHIFESPLLPGTAKRVAAYPKAIYKMMARNGDGNKKLWITEIGCPGVKRGLKVKNWWQGINPDEGQQAVWVKEVYTELLKHEAVEKVFWAFFRDCLKHWDNGVDYFGLVNWDFSKKPAFSAYKALFKEWQKKR
jgi:hypothetical protein